MKELSGLSVEIENYEDTTMSGGKNAFIIYLKVDNETSKTKKINLLNAVYVTKKREQLEQDSWLSGYLSEEDNLKPNSFKKAGIVFYKSKLEYISKNDLLYISIELPNDGIKLTLCFQNNGDYWSIIDKEKTEIEIQLTPKQLEKSLLNKIERLEAFEERLGVCFENISIKITSDENRFTLFCELHSDSGTTINDSFYVECVLYDSSASIIGKTESYIYDKDFFGFELIEMNFQEDFIANSVNKIRLYPKK